MKGPERWLHVRGTIAELGAFRRTSISDDKPRRVLPGAWHLGASAVPIEVEHDERPVGWIFELWEDLGHVWIEGIVTSEWRAIDIYSGYRSCLSAGTRHNLHHHGHDWIRAEVFEVSLCRSGCDPTAKIREHWWIDRDEGEHIAPAQVDAIARMSRSLATIKEQAA